MEKIVSLKDEDEEEKVEGEEEKNLHFPYKLALKKIDKFYLEITSIPYKLFCSVVYFCITLLPGWHCSAIRVLGLGRVR